MSGYFGLPGLSCGRKGVVLRLRLALIPASVPTMCNMDFLTAQGRTTKGSQFLENKQNLIHPQEGLGKLEKLTEKSRPARTRFKITGDKLISGKMGDITFIVTDWDNHN